MSLPLVYSLDDYKKCVQAGLKVGVNIKGVYVSAGVEAGGCNALLNEMGGEHPTLRQWCIVAKYMS